MTKPPNEPEATARMPARDSASDSDEPVPTLSRRRMIGQAAGAVGASLMITIPAAGATQARRATPASRLPSSARPDGAPTTALGTRSPFAETGARTPTGATAGSSLTPLQDLTGTITPSDLHFERHHAGVPAIDPSAHRLVIHGLVDRPMSFSMDDLRRFPPVTRTYFVECSGNGRAAWRDPKPEMSPQRVDGLTSNSEWTGVPLAVLLREVGVRDGARWILAEGADACLMTRSVPIEKAMNDALLAWAQNGEAIRPEQGFPLRLLLPGWEGNINVKWLRRLELGREPWMTRWETSKYTDPLKDGTARLFSFDLDAKSIITSPAHPARVASPGWHPITGLAWSGRGRITRVEVSTNGGQSWRDAQLQDPVLARAHTRFVTMWNWSGAPTLLLSRATDETGYVQPTYRQLVDARGVGTDYHFNCIRGWRVEADGRVFYQGET